MESGEAKASLLRFLSTKIPLQKEKKGKTRRARGKERVSSRLVETLASKFKSGTSAFLSIPSPRQFLDNGTNKAIKKTTENANGSWRKPTNILLSVR